MKIFGYLLLMLFFLSNPGVECSFSINEILDYLQETGYYNIFQAVKMHFGDDVAINICYLLIPSYDCETIIKVYMTGKYSINLPYRVLGQLEPSRNEEEDYQIISDPIEYKKELSKEIKINKEVEPLIDLILFYYDILLRNLDPKDINIFFKKVNKIEIK